MGTSTLTAGQPAIERPGTAAPASSRRRRHGLAVFGGVTLAVLALACAFGPLVLPYDDQYIDLRNRFAPPLSGLHVLGTDQMGRDMLARLLMAGRISLTVGLAAMAVIMAIGVTVGLVAGYYQGAVGAVRMRFVDAALCFPTIFLLLALSAFVEPDVGAVILLIACTTWMEVARIVEGQIRSLRRRDYAVAAQALGVRESRIL
jgi:peptide/nickel transport system permease protein